MDQVGTKWSELSAKWSSMRLAFLVRNAFGYRQESRLLTLVSTSSSESGELSGVKEDLNGAIKWSETGTKWSEHKVSVPRAERCVRCTERFRLSIEESITV